TATRDFAGSSGQHPLASRGRENWNDCRKADYVSRFSDECVFTVATSLAGDAWRLRNSFASARYACAAGPLDAYSRIDFPKLGASLKRTLRGITVLYTRSPKCWRTSATTCSLRFVRPSNMVMTIPASSRRLFAPESRTCSTNRTIFTNPSSAKYSHWIGVKSSSAAASALLIRIPSDGGQSIKTKSNV